MDYRMTERWELVDKLNTVIDQAKFIKNILVCDNKPELECINKYLSELKIMVDDCKRL